jgi:hypothetical protein
MTLEFQEKCQKKLSEYRVWSKGRSFLACKLVQYVGVELAGVIDVSIDEVEPQIEGLLGEGFYVDWADHNNFIYLMVWEYSGPEPDWNKVFAEQSLVNVEALLRAADFDKFSS